MNKCGVPSGNWWKLPKNQTPKQNVKYRCEIQKISVSKTLEKNKAKKGLGD